MLVTYSREFRFLDYVTLYKSIVTLITGTTVAQAVPLAISPILTRIYSPEDFGLLSLYIAALSIIGAVVNARYELAIMLPGNDRNAINIAALAFLICSFVSFSLFVLVILAVWFYGDYLGSVGLRYWIFILPFSVFFMGCFNILNYYSTRMAAFTQLRNSIVIKSILMAAIQIGVGLVKSGPAGLFLGQFISQFFANKKLYQSVFSVHKIKLAFDYRRMIVLAKKYSEFPKFSVGSTLANVSANYLTNFFVTIFYDVKTLGFYALVQRILGMPSSVIGEAVGQVFYKQAVSEKKKFGTSFKSFKNTFLGLTVVAVIGYGLLYVVVVDLFAFVFGFEWVVAGYYAQLLIPMLAIQFVVSPLTRINQVYMKNKNVLYWQLGLVLVYISIFLFSYWFELVFFDVLALFSFFVSLYYIYHLFLLYSYIKADCGGSA